MKKVALTVAVLALGLAACDDKTADDNAAENQRRECGRDRRQRGDQRRHRQRSTRRSTRPAMPSRTPAMRSRTPATRPRTRRVTHSVRSPSDFEKGRPVRAALFYARPKWYFGRVRIAPSLLLLWRRLPRRAAAARRPPSSPPQLNEAEDMLNDMAQNEEGPADRSSGPSNTSD